MRFYIENLFSKCGQIRRILRIWSHLLKKSLMENAMFCAVATVVKLEQIVQLCFSHATRPCLWNQQNFHPSYLWLNLISCSASTLWQNSCKTPCPQKNICGGLHSYCNSNFKIFKLKLKLKTIYSDMYSTVEVFLHLGSGWFWVVLRYYFLNYCFQWYEQ